MKKGFDLKELGQVFAFLGKLHQKSKRNLDKLMFEKERKVPTFVETSNEISDDSKHFHRKLLKNNFRIGVLLSIICRYCCNNRNSEIGKNIFCFIIKLFNCFSWRNAKSVQNYRKLPPLRTDAENVEGQTLGSKFGPLSSFPIVVSQVINIFSFSGFPSEINIFFL